MTKQEMISIIIDRVEELNSELNVAEELHGIDDEYTNILRHRWAIIYDLCKRLGILDN